MCKVKLVVFLGPPKTGKSYVRKKIGYNEWLTKEDVYNPSSCREFCKLGSR